MTGAQQPQIFFEKIKSRSKLLFISVILILYQKRTLCDIHFPVAKKLLTCY